MRTPQDLERKYDFKSLQKAVKLNEDTIHKTNATLEEFIYATLGSIDGLEGLADGNITTYYRSGVPTMENHPVVDWNESEYESHIDDMYYDKDTGYAYVFFYDDSNNCYGWEQTNDRYIVKALAIANAANDAADGKKRIFTEVPIPPYDNGDLWFTENGEIFICQISKGEDEEYAEKDFIIATKYTDDTLAIQVGNDLTVLRGTVLTVQESADKLRVDLQDLDEKVGTELEITKNGFTVKVTEATQLAQKAIDEATVNLRIDSSRGTVFKNNVVSTVLSAVIYKGPKRITDITALHEEFGTTAYLQWHWQRMDEDTFGVILSTDSRIGDGGFTLTLSPEDVDTKVTFMCELITD